MPDRAAAVERIADAMESRWKHIAGTEVIAGNLGRAWKQLADAALAAVEQGAPEGAPYDDDYRALIRLKDGQLTDARAAIRQAGDLFDARHVDRSVKEWLALPAVVEAREEKK